MFILTKDSNCLRSSSQDPDWPKFDWLRTFIYVTHLLSSALILFPTNVKKLLMALKHMHMVPKTFKYLFFKSKRFFKFEKASS